MVAVGIADYPGTKNDLNLPVADAEAIVELYSLNKSAQTRLLTNSNATKNAIISSTKALFGKAKSNDIVVLFFSGHGYPGGFAAYDEMLDYADVRAIFAASKSKHKMVFADACFSGTLRDAKGGDRSIERYDADVMLFLSSRHNESSIESPGMKNGFFTTCLVRCLKGASDYNKDRTITARELYNGVSDGVIKLSRGRQHPVMWGSFSDDMAVLRWR
jgi:hypothetical protein